METGTRIRSAVSGGDVIATRSAVQPTQAGDSRVVQLVDFASRQLTAWRALRGEASPVAVADPADLTALPGELTSKAMVIGDCDRFVVAVEHTAEDGGVTVTPLVLNEDKTQVAALLEAKTSSVGAAKLRRGAAGRFCSPVLVWETDGAAVVGLHVTAIGGTSNAVVLSGGALAEVV